jgi:chemotaxis protein CheC
VTSHPPDDVRGLSQQALDAMREVANIGAGHAATALSQITGQRIMISVPRINIAALEDVPNQIASGEEPVAAVAIKVAGDLTGLTLLVFPQPIAYRIAGLMMGGRHVERLGAIEESALKEAGNILSAAYLNALAEFLGMRILNSPPVLAVDMSDAVLSSTYIEVSEGAEYVFCVESEFQLANDTAPLRGFFLLLPDPPSLRAMLTAIRVA